MSRLTILITIAVLFLSGCATAPQTLSSIPIPADYQELGVAKCGACSLLLFDIIPIGFRGMSQRAYDCAVRNKSGDGILNPTIKHNWFWWFFGSGYCVEVSGTVIKKK